MLYFLLLTLGLARAEYRAFEIVITNQSTGQERVVISTLDPRLYRRYYPVKLEETVLYRNTWMCRGNTSNFQPVCPSPDTTKVSAPKL